MSQPRFDIQTAAVIGAGTMGRGIVMSLANAGVQVLWLDNNPEMLEQALVVVADTYAHNVRQGRIDEAEATARRERIAKVADYQALADVDLVIEAVYENLELKQNIFRELDGIVKPSGILASNTSALDIDAIAAVTNRPEQVVGLHFFSPAHIMKLLEIVRGAKTSKAVLEASTALGKRMGKVSVVAGNCPGFIGNRMLATYVREARMMLLEGAYPHQVDAARQGFGFAMGPFRMAASARSRAWATTATPKAAARPSTIRKWTPWCSASPSASAMSAARSARRKSSSAACWRWSMRAPRFSRKAWPSPAPISTPSTSTVTASRPKLVAR